MISSEVRMTLKRWCVTVMCALAFGSVQVKAQGTASQPVAQDELFKAIKAQDAALFTAYNTCDLKTLGAMVTDDLEFYHDITGLAVGRKVFVESIQNNICGKVQRQLVESTLEVHPLKNYGAVEIGVHRFLHPGQQDHDVLGEARFVMLWQLAVAAQGWRLASRAGHQL
jgi:hypothetical protein